MSVLLQCASYDMVRHAPVLNACKSAIATIERIARAKQRELATALLGLVGQLRGRARLEQLAQRAFHLAPEHQPDRLLPERPQRLVGVGQFGRARLAPEPRADALVEMLRQLRRRA